LQTRSPYLVCHQTHDIFRFFCVGCWMADGWFKNEIRRGGITQRGIKANR